MDFEFKHFVFMTAMLCAAWAIIVSSMVAYDHYTGKIDIQSEIPTVRIESPFQFLNKFEAVQQTMNVVLPLGLLCIAFLAYTYSANPIGIGSLAIAAALFVVATISVFDAGEVVEKIGEEDLSLVVWWMPKDKDAESLNLN